MALLKRHVSRTVVVCVFLTLLAFQAGQVHGEDGKGLLMRTYQQAHETGGLQDLMALVYWEGAAERTRELIVKKLKKYLGYAIIKIEMRPLSGEEDFNSLGFRPNLKPVGWLVVTFEPLDDDFRYLGQAFVVGEKGEDLFITVAVPVL